MKRHKLQQEIDKLKAQLARLEEKLKVTSGFDWDNEDPEVLFEHPNWNTWENCPVGTLAREHGINPQTDPVLSDLACLTDDARNGHWECYVSSLRTAVRAYIEQLKG